MARALVVGAGMAGLTAALRLEAAGVDVTVLEATGSVGGRLWSTALANGAVVEMGGEWIRDDQEAVIGLARLLDVALAPISVDFSLRDFQGEPPIPREDHARVGAVVSTAIASLSDQERMTMSAADLLDDLDDGSPAFALFRLRIEGSAAIPLVRVGVDELIGDFGVGEATYLRVAEGNQALAYAAARRLADIRMDTPIDSIEVVDGQVRATSGEKTFEAEGVVVAVPLPILRRLRFDPPLDAALNQAIREIEMGTAAKLAASTSSSPPLVARQNESSTWWCWTGTGADGEVREAVTAFAGTQRAIDAVDGEWRPMVEAVVPEAELGDDVRFVDWGSERWTGGCYSALGPGQESLLSAFDRSGAVVFAGEHTGGWGSIDGAIVSGDGAAGRLISFLDGASTPTPTPTPAP